APVRLDDRLADRKAEPRSLSRLSARSEEALEEARLLLFRDPDACVRDVESDVPVLRREPHVDAAAVGRELERVREQVVDDLADALAVEVDQAVLGRDVQAELDLPRRCLRLEARARIGE